MIVLTADPVVGSLFSGYGGLDLAVHDVVGGRVAWHCEIEDAPSKVLAAHWPDVPNHGDITAVDWAAVEPVDILTGGFPCQDVSHAGARAGLGPGTRSGLWARMADAIDHLRPALVVAENVRGLLSVEAHSDVEPCPWCLGDTDGEPPLRALGAVVADLADLGYDAAWIGLPASSVGAPHERFRLVVAAWPSTPDADGPTSARLADPSEWGEERGTAPRRDSGSAGGGESASNTDDAGRDGRPRPSGQGGRVEPANGGHPAPDADDAGCREHGRPVAAREEHASAQRGSGPAPDVVGGEPERRGVHRIVGGPEAPEPREEDQRERAGNPARDRGEAAIDWGEYGPAIDRWSRVLGRPAPAPTEPGRNGNPRLSPRFVEFMMGLPDGWVTDLIDDPSQDRRISRNDALKMLGNGVVPQQVAAGLRHLLGNVGVRWTISAWAGAEVAGAGAL